jgi:hypothetical protein
LDREAPPTKLVEAVMVPKPLNRHEQHLMQEISSFDETLHT